jgi:hypothetical protein
MSDYIYVGQELELFLEARNWKIYWLQNLKKYVGGNVADVGAGIGATLISGNDILSFSSWTAIEPDQSLYSALCKNLQTVPNPHHRRITPVCGTIKDVAGPFDTILYIDVIEHIEDDRTELIEAATKLASGGRLITVTPAHNYLFSEFDRHVGHFRRYDEGMLRSLQPDGLELERAIYLDSAGMLLSAANRLILKSSLPTKGQIKFWDRAIVPISRILDPVIQHRFGKTILGIWSKR